ncbi:helix-turn-helix domain-containing protein [Fructilactobacillus myrtifloralis]|uniref:Helix-turn-helix domain-containing protein n=1 Tax=Fructilactobacillus myrtifloralis TaxID=2940301 RepID=A0ABY5BPS0_9LACO|nr:helix-turn-helix domain-containing protein [Fructilactobacillus myrtifloralis]USS85709.1 helix-turn-helix domain-containing protein [Fructilactobacillus myrtifloralis]
MELAQRLKAARTQQHLTQQEVAAHMHVSRKTVSSWETGRSTANLDVLHELADLYQVDLPTLLGEPAPSQTTTTHRYRDRFIRYKRWGYFSKYAYFGTVSFTMLGLLLLVLPYRGTSLLLVPPLVLTLGIIILYEQNWWTITTNRPLLWKLGVVTPVLFVTLYLTGYLLNQYVYHSPAFMHTPANWLGLLLLAGTVTAGALMTIIFPLKRLTVRRSSL